MKIIFNPAAGHGKALKYRAELMELLQDRGQSFDLIETEGPGHAVELAKTCSDRGDSLVVVMGGDGTIAEVINGILGSGTRLGLIPIGTGNDLARSLDIPFNDIPSALRILETGEPRSIDIGQESSRRFVLMVAMGFPALVAEEANRMRRVKGSLSFFTAVYKALNRLSTFEARIVLDDEEFELECTSILVQNTPYCGGGQLMAPGASLWDGKLDVVIVRAIGKLDLMLNFPRVYSGRHIEHPDFEIRQARKVEIHPLEPRSKMFDGDPGDIGSIRAGVLHRALEVVVPVK